MPTEFDSLQLIASQHGYSDICMELSLRYFFENIVSQYLSKTDRILELGPAEGTMTKLLHSANPNLDVVEASTSYCKALLDQNIVANAYNMLFEEFVPDQPYNLIVASHVLEHVIDPSSLLRSIAKWLTPDGLLISAVPNAKSIHRIAAEKMGLLNSIYSLNESDTKHGHRRVFDTDSFHSLFKNSGFHITDTGGYWLKPLSNGQIIGNWSIEMLDAFIKMGSQFPTHSAEIFAVARLSIN